MKIDLTDVVWLDDQQEISLAELAEISGLSAAELGELVENGALVPNNPLEEQWTFSGNYIVTVQTVCRLRQDFDLDLNALGLALLFLDRIRELESQLYDLRAQLPHRHP